MAQVAQWYIRQWTTQMAAVCPPNSHNLMREIYAAGWAGGRDCAGWYESGVAGRWAATLGRAACQVETGDVHINENENFCYRKPQLR